MVFDEVIFFEKKSGIKKYAFYVPVLPQNVLKSIGK
jgi:hypothetical protein